MRCLKRLVQPGAELRSGVAVKDVSPCEEGGWWVHLEKESLRANKVVLSTGGLPIRSVALLETVMLG